MKSHLRFPLFFICVTLILPWLAGCSTIPNSGVQTFAAGVTTAQTQTDTAFQAITTLTSPSIIQYAALQPTLNDTNFLPVLDPQSIAIWDQVFSALQKYSQNLVLLTSPGITTNYENAVVSLSGEIKQAGTDLKAQGLTSGAGSMNPSFAAAFTELGDLIINAKAQHDAKKVLATSDPAVRLILTTMADAIGASPTDNLRGTVHAHWEQLKANQKLAFLSANSADRLNIATTYATLLNGEATQDLTLAALNKSLLALADAHHALAIGDNLGVMTAVSSVEQELQNTLNLANRFEAISATSTSKP